MGQVGSLPDQRVVPKLEADVRHVGASDAARIQPLGGYLQMRTSLCGCQARWCERCCAAVKDKWMHCICLKMMRLLAIGVEK
jgi:hypothetical protein